MAPIAVVVVDENGLIAFVNAQAERLFGYVRSEMVGKPIESLVPAVSRNAHRAQRKAYLTQASQRPMGVGRDLLALRKDGTEIPVEIGLSSLRTSEGVFVLGAVVDITARKRAEQFLHEPNRRTGGLATVAHELRNRLAALSNALRLLRLGTHEAEARTLAERQITRLIRIADEMLRVPATGDGADAETSPVHRGRNAHPLRLLIVDNKPDVVETLTPRLEVMGHVVRAVADGMTALDVAATFAPDVAVIVLDTDLGGVDGYEVARSLRAQDAAHGPRLVALTSGGSTLDRQGLLAAGFDRHFVKPVDPVMLAEVLAALPSLRS